LLRVERGSVVAMIGASGSGKSTLLRCINLLQEPDRGHIRVGNRERRFGDSIRTKQSDRELAAFRAATGVVFQHFNLFPHMTAIGNVTSGPSIVKGIARHEAAEIGRALLARVADKADSHPSQLSGGQLRRDRPGPAMNPAVMLLDEVTSALDPELVGEVLGVIEQFAKEGMTMIIATHEVAFAHEVADLIAFMSDGVIVESGPPGQIFEHPENPRTCGFLARFHRSMGSFSAPP
jgi:polar amino acid transport system ATP-binding protein